MQPRDSEQLKVDIKFERLDLKSDSLQNDVTGLRRELELFRNETRNQFDAIRSEFRTELQTVKEDIQILRTEIRAGFDNLERIVLRAIDRRQQ